jgi:hypothetical protein
VKREAYLVKRINIIIILLVALLLPLSGWTATYYLGDVSGTLRYSSGRWPNSEDTSAATVNVALRALEGAGHTLVIEAGTYTSQICPLYGNITVRSVESTDPDYPTHSGEVALSHATEQVIIFGTGWPAPGALSNITVKNITINQASGNNYWPVYAESSASGAITGIVFDGLKVNINTATAYDAAIYIKASGLGISGLEIKNCTIMNNTWTSPTATLSGIRVNDSLSNSSIHNNIISDANRRFMRGIWITAGHDISIYENVIGYCGPGASTQTGNGIAITDDAYNINVYRNLTDSCEVGIAVFSRSTMGYIRVYYNTVTNSTRNGIYTTYNNASATDYWIEVYNNTIYMPSPTYTDSSGLNQEQHEAKLIWKNNVVYVGSALSGGASHAVAITRELSCEYKLNNNLYYVTGTATLGRFMSTVATTLAEWQSAAAGSGSVDATDNDANSQYSDPIFVSSTDYRLKASSPANKTGTAIAGIHDQAGCLTADGVSCYTATPNMGAYSAEESSGGWSFTTPSFTAPVWATPSWAVPAWN